jgi:hypothetical protein
MIPCGTTTKTVRMVQLVIEVPDSPDKITGVAI